MPYTNEWDDTFPSDSEAANAIGANLRQLRLDLDERLTGFIVEDIEDDPWVLTDEVSGHAEGLLKIVPFSSFVNYVTPAGIGIFDGYITISATQPAYAHVPIPNGCTITGLEWLVDRGAASSVTCLLVKTSFNASATQSTVKSTAVSVAGLSITTASSFTEVVDEDYTYHFRVAPTGGSASLYAVRITFDRPATANAT